MLTSGAKTHGGQERQPEYGGTDGHGEFSMPAQLNGGSVVAGPTVSPPLVMLPVVRGPAPGNGGAERGAPLHKRPE